MSSWVSLTLVTNAEGFAKYSKIHKGTISGPSTLLQTIQALRTATSEITRKPLILLDAAFSTNENLVMRKENDFDYLCVTRAKLKDYTAVNTD